MLYLLRYLRETNGINETTDEIIRPIVDFMSFVKVNEEYLESLDSKQKIKASESLLEYGGRSVCLDLTKDSLSGKKLKKTCQMICKEI